MDDIYSDLENFNDVNIVEELKNENKELKFKLEEYSGAMHQLQKNILQDFDKLSAEYKNLEKNYSSLLKTARAEIERKTETIKNLNLEKDKLVINSLQKGKNILQYRRSNFKDNQHNTKIENTCLNEVKKIIKDSAERLDNQLHVNRQPSIETVSSIATDCPSHNENKISKTEHKTPKEGRDGQEKAYTKNNVQERPSIRKVTDRQTSMPSFGECEPKFSSDEDSRKTNSEQQQTYPSLVGENVRHFERNYEQQNYVLPESFDYYQAPPSSYRDRGNRYNEFERQRNYDDNSRKYFSHDNHHRYSKQFSENYNQRDYTEKRRGERSPPTDRYNRSKSRDRRHKLERENYRDYGRHSFHNGDHLGAKNKSIFNLEEPSRKRPKDSHSKHTTEYSFSKEKERSLSERHTFTKPQEPMDSSSCQSPDYVHIDSNVSLHPVKEIRHTALTPLPDPRLLSNKYILKSNSEKPILATVAGSNVDIIPITNPTWGEGKVKSLSKSLDLVSEIYMDIDNLGKSPSIESGEILSLDEDHYSNYSNIPTQVEDNVKSSVHKSHQIVSHVSDKKEKEKPSINEYKIPRLKKQNATKEPSITQEQKDVSKKKSHDFVKDFKVIVEGKHLSEQCPETYSNNISHVSTISNKKPESILQKLMNEKKASENASSTKYRKTDKIVNISTIEGDLELSDEETTDNMDLLKENTMRDDKKDLLTKKEEHTLLEKNRVNKSDDKIKKSKERRKSVHSRKEDVKEKTRESSRKRKNKKQTDQEISSGVKEDLSPQTKRSKEKVNSSDQKKNKFTDLFGDTNSLITPDDLGIPKAVPEKYVPVFENTQDAVDLSVEDITMPQKSDDKTNIDEKSNQISDVNKDSENINSNENNYNKSNISTTLIYENTVSETDANVVKTVIISTGVQPQSQHISKDIDVTFPHCNIKEELDFKKSALNIIKASATSTPYKLINPKESQIIDSTIISDESINTKENVDKTDLSTNINLKTNISEDKIESDIPDVRIFVRRRKKAMKKPI